MSMAQPAPLQFVKLREAYLDEILQIEVEVYPEPWTRSMFLDEIRNQRSYFCVAFLREALVGYGGFWQLLNEVHITSVVVRDEWRRHGFGRQIVNHLLDIAFEVTARIATLEVRVSNIQARNLYLSMGFSPIEIRKRYYPKNNEDALVMLKELA